MKFTSKVTLLGFLLGALGCAHSYYYTPEIAGDGAISSKGGIIYSIPPSNPRYRMKVAYLGIADESISSQFQEKTKNIRVRMYIMQNSGNEQNAPGTIDPRDEILDLDSGDLKLHVAAVFARSKKRPLIELAQRK